MRRRLKARSGEREGEVHPGAPHRKTSRLRHRRCVKAIKDDIAALKKMVHKTKPEEIDELQAREIRRLIDQLKVSAADILPKDQKDGHI